MEELESADEADDEEGPRLRKRRLKVIRRAYKGKGILGCMMIFLQEKKRQE